MIKAVIFLAAIAAATSDILPQLVPAYSKVPLLPFAKVPVVPFAKVPVVPFAKVPVVPFGKLPFLPVKQYPVVLPVTKFGYEAIPQPIVRDYRIGGYHNLGYLKSPEYFGYNGLHYNAHPYSGYGNGYYA